MRGVFSLLGFLIIIANAFCYEVPFYPDLEGSFVQDFVLQTKQIVIAEYPLAFNASIIRYKGELLLSFRIIPDRRSSFTSYIGLVFLDEEFNPKSKPQILQTRDPKSKIPSRIDDARLLVVADDLYIVYSDNAEAKISKGGFRVYVGKLNWEAGQFFMTDCDCLLRFEGESRDIREKNWTPFDFEGELLLAYSVNPHRIFRPLLGFSECETVTCTSNKWRWDWGVLRGGTPGLLVDGEYLTFFHSCHVTATTHSDGKPILHYYMGAYTFLAEPPFQITKKSPCPIVAKGFYTGSNHYKPYWKPVNVVFPCGFVFDDEYIWVSYGRQDHEIWIVKLDKQKLLDSLVP